MHSKRSPLDEDPYLDLDRDEDVNLVLDHWLYRLKCQSQRLRERVAAHAESGESWAVSLHDELEAIYA